MKWSQTQSTGKMNGKEENIQIPLPLLNKIEILGFTEKIINGCISQVQYKKLVLWLEEESIRLFHFNKRSDLRDFHGNHNWWTAFVRYCNRLDFHFKGGGVKSEDERQLSDLSFSRAERINALNHLLNIAIEEMYRDNVDDGTLVEISPKVASQDPPPVEMRCVLVSLLDRVGVIGSCVTQTLTHSDVVAAIKVIYIYTHTHNYK
eukprot:GHVR01032392.1.p1 GENE.GHVR01032392.1~~GHVR01032392.1.p1  ORF type:complete len:205 (+),score=54.49 GHVR01032392.1:1-615(+)